MAEKKAAIAGKTEILRTLTEVMRGECEGEKPKVSERCRAAELLAKRSGLFEDAGKPRPVSAGTVRAVNEAVAALKEKYGPGGA